MKLRALFALSTLCLLTTTYAQPQQQTTIARLPSFTPFNWSEISTKGYVIEGTICNNASGVGQPPCGHVTFVIDPPNRRILFDLENNGGKYYILDNQSFIVGGIPDQPDLCFSVPGFTFTQQVAGYLNVLSTPGSTSAKARYFGRALDVGSCNDKIAADMTVRSINSQGILTEFNFAQMYPVGTSCSFITGNITFKRSTLRFPDNLDSYFVLPSSCNGSAPSWCATIYPPGNPCGV